VAITGAGVVSPLADSRAALRRALAEGRSALRPLETFDPGAATCRRGAELNGFAPERYLADGNLRPLDRTGRLAAAAARLALADAGWTPELLREVEAGLVLGTMFGSVRTIAEFDRRALTAGPSYVKPFDFANSVINAAAGQAAVWHRLEGVNTTVAGGPVAGLQALAAGADLVRAGRSLAVLAGGAEEVCFESFLGFARDGRLAAQDGAGAAVPFHARRTGFHLGEGAALLALEEAEAARARGARVLAFVRGSGSAFDPSRGADPARAADAVARAVGGALAEAGLAPEDVDCLSAAACGGPATDRAEAAGVAAALGERAANLPVTAVKGQLGEALGASGALQAAVLLAALETGELPGIAGLDEPEPGLLLAAAGPEATRGSFRRGLVTAVGLDGAAVALVLERPSGRGAEATP